MIANAATGMSRTYDVRRKRTQEAPMKELRRSEPDNPGFEIFLDSGEAPDPRAPVYFCTGT